MGCSVELRDGLFFFRASLAATLYEIVTNSSGAAVIGVDVPLGMLLDRGAPRTPPPPTSSAPSQQRLPGAAALRVASTDFAAANRVCRELTGSGLSRQSWALRPKLLEANTIWERHPGLLFEAHPEVSFRTMAGAPPTYAKKTWSGQAKRRELLLKHGIKLPDQLGTGGPGTTRRRAGRGRGRLERPSHGDGRRGQPPQSSGGVQRHQDRDLVLRRRPIGYRVGARSRDGVGRRCGRGRRFAGRPPSVNRWIRRRRRWMAGAHGSVDSPRAARPHAEPMALKEAIVAVGPVGTRERALAPDPPRPRSDARSHRVGQFDGLPVRLALYGIRQHIVEEHLLDRIISVLAVTLVDGRAYPMFAALFAYGVVQIFQRHAAAGVPEPQTTALLRRRSRWLIAFGFAHVLVLFPGDILGLYGVVGFILVALARVSDRKLIVVAASWLVVVAIVQGAAYMMPSTGERSFFFSFETPEPLEALLLRPVEWLMTPFGVIGVGSAVLVGMWAARRGILTNPAAHRPLLVRTAAIGLTTAVVGGLPVGLAVGHFWEPTSLLALWGLSALHAVTGIAGGLGYASVIGLLASRIGDRPGRVVEALVACGQRSLSCYLFQSVVFVALLMPYTLGLGARRSARPGSRSWPWAPGWCRSCSRTCCGARGGADPPRSCCAG